MARSKTIGWQECVPLCLLLLLLILIDAAELKAEEKEPAGDFD